MYINGYQITTHPLLTKDTKVKVMKSKYLRLFEYIIKWNPCNFNLLTPNHEYISEPSSQVYLMNGRIVVHPETLQALRSSA